MIATLVHIVIYVIVIGLIVWLLLWLIDAIPLPEPFHNIARIVIIVVSVLAVILLLLSLVEPGSLKLGRLSMEAVAPAGQTLEPQPLKIQPG